VYGCQLIPTNEQESGPRSKAMEFDVGGAGDDRSVGLVLKSFRGSLPRVLSA
jgi:hypothetical protein